MADDTRALLDQLQVLDGEEDRIVDVLVRHGAALEEARRQANMGPVADLRALRDGMSALEQTLDALQANVARAEAGSGYESATGQASMTFEELAAQLREQDAQATRLKEALRERLLRLDPQQTAPGAEAGSEPGSPQAGPERPAVGLKPKPLAGGARPKPAPGARPKPLAGLKPKPPARPQRPTAAPAGSARAAIRKHGGRYEDVIVREARRHGLALSLVCAVIETESGFRNIYGRDNGARPNPIRSPQKGVLAVTQDNYRAYLRHVSAGKDPNGVGPMQLTFRPFQRRADKLGGCWKVGPNIRTGCEVLADNIERLGSTREGVRAYNGSGDDARRYAAKVLERQAIWHERLKGKAAAQPTPIRPPDRPSAGAKPRRPRTFALKGSMHGEDVRAWQMTLRRQFATWKVDYPLAVDGHYGPITRSATSDALRGLGIGQEKMRDGVTPQLRRKVRHKHLNPAERARFAARAPWRRALKKKFAHEGVAPPINKILTSAHGFKGGHDGVDLICNANVPIMALCDAEVIDVRGGGWWGKSPTGDVTKGDGIIQLKCLTDVGPFKRGMHFGYGHAEHAVVRKGQRVKAGEVIGKAGYANAWHVHFMVNSGGTMKGVGDRDPMPFVRYAMKRGKG